MSRHLRSPRRARTGLPAGARSVALGSAGVLCVSLAVTLSPGTAQAVDPVTLFVRTTGTDSGLCGGTAALACKTVQQGVLRAGAFGGFPVVVDVGAGNFAEAPFNATDALAIGDFSPATANPSSLTLRGAGAGATHVLPSTARRTVRIAASFPVTLQGLTIRDGRAPAATTAGGAEAAGGGILATGSGNLVLTDVRLTGNRAGAGLSPAAAGSGTTGTSTARTGGTGKTGSPGGTGGAGGGVAYLGAGTLSISGSTIDANAAGTGGTGATGGTGGTGFGPSGNPGVGGPGGPGGVGGTGGAGGGVAFAGNAISIVNSTVVLNSSGLGGTGGKGGAGGTGGGGAGALGGDGADGGDGSVGATGGAGGAGGGVAALAGTLSSGVASLIHATVAGNSTGAGGAGGAPGSGGSGGNGVGLGGGDGAGGDEGATPGTAGSKPASNGVARGAGTLTLVNALLANANSNCDSATSITAANSAFSDASCLAAPGTNTAAPSVAVLGGLAANGGSTPTVVPGTGNVAIGFVPAAVCMEPADQRGRPRPGLTAPACTAGAYEPQVPPVAPTLVGKLSSAHGRTKFHWYRDTVTVSFICTPGSSPLTTPCPPPMVVSTSGANRGGTVSIANAEGLTASLQVALNIDKSKPRIAIRGVKKGKNYNQQRRIRCDATDSLSGPYVCQMTAKAKLINSNRQVRVSYTATAVDKAGNVSTKKGYYTYNR